MSRDEATRAYYDDFSRWYERERGRGYHGMIDDLEPVDREVYCGGVGWVDADRRQGALNVAIRTFWFADDEIRFGTGGGITWDSDPGGEWEETQLKARRLLHVAAGTVAGRR